MDCFTVPALDFLFSHGNLILLEFSSNVQDPNLTDEFLPLLGRKCKTIQILIWRGAKNRIRPETVWEFFRELDLKFAEGPHQNENPQEDPRKNLGPHQNENPGQNAGPLEGLGQIGSPRSQLRLNFHFSHFDAQRFAQMAPMAVRDEIENAFAIGNRILRFRNGTKIDY